MTNYTTATTWGSKTSSGSPWARVGIAFEYYYPSGGASPTASDSKVTARAIYRVDTSVNMEEGSNSPTYSGDFPAGADPASFPVASGDRVVSTGAWVDFTLAYGATATKSQSWSVNISYLSEARPSVSDVPFTVPARPYTAPSAPTGAAVAKNSDTSHTVTWTNAATTAAPYASLHVERWDNVSASWYVVVSPAGTSTSYTDTTTAADRRYQFRVRAQNAAGYSPYATTGYSTTTPAAHADLAWTKDGADVVLNWVKTSSLAVATEVQESTNGGSTWGATLATVAAGTNLWRHTAPSTATTHKYRVRPVVDGVSGAWVESTVVQLLAPPLAPTALIPDGATVDNEAGSTSLTWQHNSADGTTQTAYEVQYRVNGGSWASSGKVSSSSAARTVASGTWAQGVSVEWQVRTYGQHASASPWSASASFSTGARPVATIQAPAAGVDYGQSDLAIAWTFYDAEGTSQAAALLELLDASNVVLYAATVSGAAAVHPVSVALENLTSYTARVSVQDGSGLWSAPATVAFTTDFVPPPAPLLSGTWDRDLGKVTLSIDNAGATLPATWVPAAFNRIWRSIDNGDWELIADAVPLDTTLTDWTPATKGSNAYRVESVSETPTSAFSDTLTITTSSPWVFVSGGPGYSTVARLKGAPAVALTTGREKVLHQFAGRRSPVEFVGAARARVFKVSGSVDGHGLEASMGDWASWETISDLPAPLLYRDPMGRRLFGSISDVEISHEAPSKYAKVSATITEVAQ